MTSRFPEKLDVLVIGAGITGLSAAYHLLSLGFRKIGLVESQDYPSVSSATPGMISGGFPDNITRLNHTLGFEVAAKLWNFGDRSFQSLTDFAVSQNIPIKTYRRIRYITSQHEQDECQVAIQLLNKLNPAPNRALSNTRALKAVGNGEILGVQDDGPFGGWIDTKRLLFKLRQLFLESEDKCILGTVNRIAANSNTGRLDISLKEDGKIIDAEFCVAACHLGIAEIVPELKSSLISSADQWLEFEFAPAHDLPPGLAFSLNHGLEWGVVSAENKISAGGANFFRQLSGIGALSAEINERSSAFLKKRIGSLTGRQGDFEAKALSVGLECRPCDELPIIGPMFGNGRILTSTGYLGAGLSMGFFAGKCIAELIATGKSPDLPRFLWPERLRSL